ncbi:hypothetical protein PSN45_001142 [Yamadazyma tenuis]|uniref:NAD(P)-binding protein n=1 Tax=Candida tenuis (strain ATCC 10573 / BCRC 21748 / CBS 615 / JCM 9827 / NBRC 10315 / NRRL Y-1498 / VKM Y-70) TaxID=590646 RepID=G3B8P2_CANTC|nr:NAD(P)-binding protein [Yamadazyma tenuis ATCC 10573]XP_006689068.1 uncharacterized protein CANTEDRAFT_115860 [Yamadazyma tenuis ATCC 10573]EGV62897.1 NAD(P)-binding protein [Yamadazyma tenuis ATCC 10573]EGV62898.1 hypothetical protein CANTEDRAFT_115860 [Yamadazyma tenuis ATCC 10573]WEJ93670.1 hypothetical protein PSN45_001142 [Yamadazyma tenuis]
MVQFNVNGKIALVTGGTRGIGYDIAEYFVLNGIDTIIITSRKPDACKDAKASLEACAASHGKSVKVISEPCDMANDDDLRRFHAIISSQITKLDILIANAGASYGTPFDKHPVAQVRKILDINITGVFHSVQLFASLLENAGSAQDPSRVIIVSSIVAFASDFKDAYGYVASKAGVAHLGRNLALTLAPRNINVNSIAPGFFPTKMTKYLYANKRQETNYGNPRKRWGQKEDIQNAVLWLCSRESNYVNGINLNIDGGLHLVGTSKL